MVRECRAFGTATRRACGCVLVSFVLSIGGWSCTSGSPPNVLVVVADTLRADRVGAYGSTRGLTPFVDSLAARGSLFRKAYAPSSWTNPSVASILTSRYQSQHGIVSFDSVLADTEMTLPELLGERGYATGGFSANGLIAKQFGFDQGYDRYEGHLIKVDGKLVAKQAEQINADALEWLDERPRSRGPIFLYVQYMEPHTPYRPSEESMEHVFDGRERPDMEEVNTVALFFTSVDFEDDLLTAIRDVYDACVMTLDQQLRSLFTELDRRGFLDDALVVITADHGEEFRDHGFLGHAKTLYNEVTHVPLIILAPGQNSGVEIDDDVSLVDLAPTILDWLGDDPPASFEGRSLKPLIRRQTSWWARLWSAPPPRPAFSELIRAPDKGNARDTPHLRAVVDGAHKLITGIGGEREYYDLAADPREKKPDGLTAAERGALARDLERFVAAVAPEPAAKPIGEPDAETKERMRALGYD